MKRFKLHQGKSIVYDISRETYEEATKNRPPYEQTCEDGQVRHFAVCPACDNPIQLIGLYSKNDNSPSPYGKHYNRDTSIANHNQQAYWFCPYASHSHSVTKNSRREHLTDFEREIYRVARDNFDLVKYVIEKQTGLYVSQRLAEKMLRNYVASEGHMYYWAALYNIPWMFLYFLIATPCYGMLVKENSALWEYFNSRNDVVLDSCQMAGYNMVHSNGKYLDLYLATIKHKRRVADDEVKETVELNISSTGKDGLPKTEKAIILEIDEQYFPNLLCTAKYRRQNLIGMAKSIMGDI